MWQACARHQKRNAKNSSVFLPSQTSLPTGKKGKREVREGLAGVESKTDPKTEARAPGLTDFYPKASPRQRLTLRLPRAHGAPPH